MTGKQLKNAILQLAIQGELVPQDAADEPASALLARIRKEKEQLVKAGKLKPACRQAGKKDPETTPICDEEKPFEIPESWEWVRLGEIFSHNNGKQLNRADTKGELHDYITTSNLYWDSFDLKEIRQMLFTDEELVRCTATKGDLLVCEGGDVGRSAIWDKDFDICIQNHIHRLRAYCQLCTRYFLYLLMFNKSTGLIGGKGIGIQGLSAKALHNILVALPPLSEQHRIVSKIEELMPLVEEYGAAQEKLNRLNEALPEALKKSILQQAIQGKLVSQDAADEPASVLLAKIRKEKEQLVKAGKLKPACRQAGKKDLATTPIPDDEKPFEIPVSWEWCRIEEISDSYIGLTYKPTDVAENGTVVLRSSNIQDGRIDLNDKVKVNLSIPEKLIVHENDILICARNGSSKLVGKSALITKEADGMTFGAFMAICKTSFYDFVYQFLQSDLFFSQLREVSGTTTINQLTQKNFNSFVIPLPPLSEQHRIVAKIEELMAMVDGMK